LVFRKEGRKEEKKEGRKEGEMGDWKPVQGLKMPDTKQNMNYNFDEACVPFQYRN
jgi:hypothetical protein